MSLADIPFMVRPLSTIPPLAALLLALAGCSSSDPDGAIDAGAPGDGGASVDASANTNCPATPPTASESCDGIVAPGVSCVYERCGAEGIVRATCDDTGGEAAWSVATGSCGSDACNGFACGAGTVCAANVGGAYIVDCRPHACETGPLTCECVCGEGTQCDVGDSSGSGAEFTCYVDCGAKQCPVSGD